LERELAVQRLVERDPHVVSPSDIEHALRVGEDSAPRRFRDALHERSNGCRRRRIRRGKIEAVPVGEDHGLRDRILLHGRAAEERLRVLNRRRADVSGFLALTEHLDQPRGLEQRDVDRAFGLLAFAARYEEGMERREVVLDRSDLGGRRRISSSRAEPQVRGRAFGEAQEGRSSFRKLAHTRRGHADSVGGNHDDRGEESRPVSRVVAAIQFEELRAQIERLPLKRFLEDPISLNVLFALIDPPAHFLLPTLERERSRNERRVRIRSERLRVDRENLFGAGH
jgi:hypothetical protein